MRIVFMGTPDFAEVCLRRLYEDGHEIAAVYSKPDMPKNRGMKMQMTPVKEYALEKGIEVVQPMTLKDENVQAQLKAFKPELIVVVAYGKLLPKAILDMPKYGCVNVHASILPKYRGSAPIQWSVLNGDKVTGVTTMMMAEGMDTGDIIETLETEIGENETSEQLWNRMALLGAELISKTVLDFENGNITLTPQDDSLATHAPMLTKDLSPVDWSKSAKQIHDQVRGLIPWPVASAEFSGKRFRIFETAISGKTTAHPAGSVISAGKDGLEVACGNGEVIVVRTIQADGGKRMAVADYLRGHPNDFEIIE
ncbi:MAG: methionyl-tRNA formyltransferase [Ruminococcaceae bacterium]|nr:methionyl-tRNA formyltransferase [Oscillospiraceae bacterium]